MKKKMPLVVEALGIRKVTDVFAKPGVYNGFTFPEINIIANDAPDEIKVATWGLIPNWSKDRNIQKYTLSARIETLGEKPSFRQSVSKRCLIPATGFYEWKWLDEKGKKKQKYKMSMPNDEVFCLGGIWSDWTDKETGEIIRTASIVTTEAQGFMREVHNTKLRMPVMFSEKKLYEQWMTKEPIVINHCGILDTLKYDEAE